MTDGFQRVLDHSRETAAAYGGWSAGVHDRAAAAGTPRPGETGAAAVRERAETETDLIMQDAARGARQTVTKPGDRGGRRTGRLASRAMPAAARPLR